MGEIGVETEKSKCCLGMAKPDLARVFIRCALSGGATGMERGGGAVTRVDGGQGGSDTLVVAENGEGGLDSEGGGVQVSCVGEAGDVGFGGVGVVGDRKSVV